MNLVSHYAHSAPSSPCAGLQFCRPFADNQFPSNFALEPPPSGCIPGRFPPAGRTPFNPIPTEKQKLHRVRPLFKRRTHKSVGLINCAKGSGLNPVPSNRVFTFEGSAGWPSAGRDYRRKATSASARSGSSDAPGARGREVDDLAGIGSQAPSELRVTILKNSN